ncbi:MAG TPA: DUF4407 domain-containing protein, partial [Chitinophagaceae bacterium]|nr:DUF4407 domain-containing protein [Chitinophagaceae bacterium]
MQQNVTTISRREAYAPSAFTKFLWWLATAEKEIIVHCTIDRNRYAITGMSVLCTWLFATLAWAYFFFTVVHSLFESIALGLFMGFIILCIDRALIKGITASSKNKFLPVLFRIALAATIGAFMAQPALLYLFDKEVHAQISLDNEQRKKDKQLKIDSFYLKEQTSLLAEKNQLQQQLEAKYNEVSAARASFIQETDGTGGSGKIGLKDIAHAKQSEYQKLDNEYQLMQLQTQPALNKIDSSLAAIETAKFNEQKNFDTLLNDGFLTRIEALHNLIQSNTALQIRYYLLLMIIMLIELMPVIAKLLLPNGSYDEQVRLKELMEKEMAENNFQKELQLKETYNQTAFEQDKEFIRDFFEEAKAERKQK